MPERARYHHGDLRAALVGVAADLVREQGPGFSLAEASRRLGVSVAAPYRHFPDREALLAAVVARAYEEVAGALAAVPRQEPGPWLAAVARAYVRAVTAEPGRFDLLFGSGVDKARHPELLAAAQRVLAAFAAPAGGDEGLAVAAGVLAHGYAALSRDGALGEGPVLDAAVERGVAALVAGWGAADGTGDDAARVAGDPG